MIEYLGLCVEDLSLDVLAVGWAVVPVGGVVVGEAPVIVDSSV